METIHNLKHVRQVKLLQKLLIAGQAVKLVNINPQNYLLQNRYAAAWNCTDAYADDTNCIRVSIYHTSGFTYSEHGFEGLLQVIAF